MALPMRLITSIWVTLLLVLTASTQSLFGQQRAWRSIVPSEPFKNFLRSYLNSDQAGSNKSVRITVVSVGTNAEPAEEEVVYVSGAGSCGSGGCTLLIVEPFAGSFRLLGDIPIVQLPVRLISSMKNGHPDIGVNVRGVEVGSEYEAELSFDGTSYPDNPTLKPARRVIDGKGRKIITAKAKSTPLYD